jgi:hypothetical protein
LTVLVFGLLLLVYLRSNILSSAVAVAVLLFMAPVALAGSVRVRALLLLRVLNTPLRLAAAETALKQVVLIRQVAAILYLHPLLVPVVVKAGMSLKLLETAVLEAGGLTVPEDLVAQETHPL